MPDAEGRAGARLAPALFFVSGAAGLVYEVLWMRLFTTLFGGTAPASAATLAGFFLGLALGSAFFGARSRRFARPLLAFGLLECAVGLGALATQAVLALYQPLYPAIHATFGAWPGAFVVAKLALALVAIGIPAFFMGGTLPALAQARASAEGGLGVPVGRLYALNLLGAVAGSLAVPFLLLPKLGAHGSYAAAVAASAVVGLTAIVAGLRGGPRPEAAPVEGKAPRPGAGGATQIGIVLLLLSAFSGAATLGLQTLWTRGFSLVHESSVHAFALVVAVFLVGLAGGAELARLALRRGVPARRLLGTAWAIGGLLILVSPFVFTRLTDGLTYVRGSDWPSLLGHLLSLAGLVVLPPTVALGVAVPALLEIGAAARRAPGHTTGTLMAANTIGAIAGPLAFVFLLAPALGLWRALAWLGVLVMLVGVSGLGRRPLVAAAVLALAALAGFERAVPPPVRVRAEQGERLVSVHEGSLGTTAVIEDARDRWISVNNAYVLGGTAAAGEERWQAHLPLLLHPAPRRVAFLGLGTGITAGASLVHPQESVVAAEIVPEVVTAARESFAEANDRFLKAPQVEVVVDDGRHHLAAIQAPFDVIVTDLLVPWRPGESALYSREYYETARRALAPGGVFCQWLPVYQLSEETLLIAVATFVDTFPRTSLWRGSFLPDQPILALVGHGTPGPLDVARVDERVAALGRRDASQPFLKHPAGFWLHLVGAASPRTPWLVGARRNSDAAPWLEILGPSALADGRPERFVRERYEDVLAGIAGTPLSGTPLESLDREHVAWRATGMALARAAQVPGPAGEEGVLALLRGLPPGLREALGVERESVRTE